MRTSAEKADVSPCCALMMSARSWDSGSLSAECAGPFAGVGLSGTRRGNGYGLCSAMAADIFLVHAVTLTTKDGREALEDTASIAAGEVRRLQDGKPRTFGSVPVGAGQ